MARALPKVRSDLRRDRPDAVFSTGGYGAAAAMAAARTLRIPLAIHAVDAVPGRTLRMHARRAAAFTGGFRSAEAHLARLGATPPCGFVRIGHPIRPALRAAVSSTAADPDRLLVIGGSQGSAFLNSAVAAFAPRWPGTILLVTGAAHHESWPASANPNVEPRPYLDAAGMAEAYRTCGLAMARSGGTIAEFAMARLPSLLVPLPTSADDHQRHNADEFVAFAGAERLDEASATTERIAASLLAWRDDPGRRATAAANLADWDVPDAAPRIAECVLRVASGAGERTN